MLGRFTRSALIASTLFLNSNDLAVNAQAKGPDPEQNKARAAAQAQKEKDTAAKRAQLKKAAAARQAKLQKDAAARRATLKKNANARKSKLQKNAAARKAKLKKAAERTTLNSPAARLAIKKVTNPNAKPDEPQWSDAPVFETDSPTNQKQQVYVNRIVIQLDALIKDLQQNKLNDFEAKDLNQFQTAIIKSDAYRQVSKDAGKAINFALTLESLQNSLKKNPENIDKELVLGFLRVMAVINSNSGILGQRINVSDDTNIGDQVSENLAHIAYLLETGNLKKHELKLAFTLMAPVAGEDLKLKIPKTTEDQKLKFEIFTRAFARLASQAAEKLDDASRAKLDPNSQTPLRDIAATIFAQTNPDAEPYMLARFRATVSTETPETTEEPPWENNPFIDKTPGSEEPPWEEGAMTEQDRKILLGEILDRGQKNGLKLSQIFFLADMARKTSQTKADFITRELKVPDDDAHPYSGTAFAKSITLNKLVKSIQEGAYDLDYLTWVDSLTDPNNFTYFEKDNLEKEYGYLVKILEIVDKSVKQGKSSPASVSAFMHLLSIIVERDQLDQLRIPSFFDSGATASAKALEFLHKVAEANKKGPVCNLSLLAFSLATSNAVNSIDDDKPLNPQEIIEAMKLPVGLLVASTGIQAVLEGKMSIEAAKKKIDELSKSPAPTIELEKWLKELAEHGKVIKEGNPNLKPWVPWQIPDDTNKAEGKEEKAKPSTEGDEIKDPFNRASD